MLMFVATSVFADSTLLLKKGWQLIGSTNDIESLDIFKPKDVEQVWAYDGSTQKWLGFSPDSTIQKKINDKGFSTISSLKSWHGFWVKSKDDWALRFKDEKQSKDTNITLKKGWNLISLPINSTVSPHIFDDKTVWKYTKNSEWQFFNKEKNEDFKPISYISNSDGIWVKSDKDQVISVANESAKLHNFDDLKEVKSYIKDMVVLGNGRWYGGYYPIMINGAIDNGLVYADGVPTAGASSQKSAISAPKTTETSKTNIQEEGVDEADIIKHDGTNIFYLSNDLKDYNKKIVNVTTFANIVSNNLKPISSFKTAGDTIDMYLVGDKLVVLSRDGVNYKVDLRNKVEQNVLHRGGDISSMLVEIYDVSDITDIKRDKIFKINGSINSSRVVDGKLYLITNFTPFVEYTYPKIYVDLPECKEYFNNFQVGIPEKVEEDSAVDRSMENKNIRYSKVKDYSKCYGVMIDEDGKYYRYDYENPKITYQRLLPLYKEDDKDEKTLIEVKKFYASDKKDQQAVITTVSKIDISTGTLEDSSSVLGNSRTVYASSKALYIVSQDYPIYFGFNRMENRSTIYKFALGEDLGYKAFGFVKGNILNQFSLSEYKDILRVATTEGTSWQNNTKNSLFTIKTVDSSLVIAGVLSGLGKEGESIHSVRFIGDKGFVVTFKRTDPFYTIDLSDVNNPKKAGELEVDGFSSYLHPIGENLILGFGRDATPDGQVAGLKLELFDVSNLENPKVKDTYTFANNYAYSEVEYNHKALAFRDSDNLFAFSYSSYENSRRVTIDQLGLFQIEGEHISVFTPIDKVSNAQDSLFKRALIFDMDGVSYVAYFRDGKISYKAVNTLVKER
jgi:uncharacterized secreted protein with C-terminal beta-propeller domain